jgi:hypothetical protein
MVDQGDWLLRRRWLLIPVSQKAGAAASRRAGENSSISLLGSMLPGVEPW